MILGISAGLHAQNKADNTIIGLGTKMTCEVDFNGMRYDFIATFRDHETDLILDYEMTNDAHTSGSLYISKYALDKSTVLYNYFGGGKKRLDYETTVWVSNAIYHALKNGTSIHIDSGGGDEELKAKAPTTISCIVNGEKTDLAVLHGISDNGHEYKVLDNPDYPVILFMNLGWTISIKSIEN